MADIIDLANRRSEPKTPLDFWRQHTVRTILWPLAWKDANAERPLNWERVEFSSRNADFVPQTRGVYAFSISIKNSIMPQQGAIVYFGETSSLRRRYGEYIRARDRGPKRIKIGNLFDLWPNDLDFFFASIDDLGCDLESIEKTLNDAVIPHCVTDDFSAEIRRMVQILRA